MCTENIEALVHYTKFIYFEISRSLFETVTSYGVNRFTSRKQLQDAVTKGSTQTI